MKELRLYWKNEGIKVVLEEMRSEFVLAEETRFIEMEKMLWRYNTTLQELNEHVDIIDMSVVGMTFDLDRTKQTFEAHAGHLIQNKVDIVVLQGMVDNLQNQLQIFSPSIQPASSISSLPPGPASTLAPIAEAEEPNDDEAAQPKEDESERDCTTAVAIAVNHISSGSATASVDPTGPTASITNLAIATDSIIPTGPAAIITDSAIATGPLASNESTVPTGVKTILAISIAATGHLMDVDMTGLSTTSSSR
ncbi:hypothetical protein J132_09809 [Termitomyces sp. J132]|nr:hypothetical protein J132_09809 [Termitomyces sp. J132]